MLELYTLCTMVSMIYNVNEETKEYRIIVDMIELILFYVITTMLQFI